MTSCQYGKETLDGLLERLGERDLPRIEAGVAGIVSGGARIVGGHRRRRNVVAAAPDLDLRFAVLLRRLRLVQPLQRAIVPLVQPPAVDDRQPHLIEPVERDPERANRALQHRRVGEVESVAAVLEQLAGGAGLFAAAFGQIDVGPSGEAVFLVPDALAVAEQYECGHM
jgi:hypothetical protein